MAPHTVDSQSLILPLYPIMSRKRTQRSFPCPSPLKQTRSPIPKHRRRLRTGTEQRMTSPRSLATHGLTKSCINKAQQTVHAKELSDFKASPA